MSTSANPDSRPFDKVLFGAGMQCAKRLYLDYHYPSEQPELPRARRALAEAGSALLHHARNAFPGGRQVELERFEVAAEETAEALAGTGAVLFDAAFAHESLRVRSDVVIQTPEGLDLFEVKSGTKVKPRHIRDVAFQVMVIEACGHSVGTISVLHVNANYRHTEGGDYPVHKLFKHVDITAKVRRVLPQVQELVASFERALGSADTLSLPTGTYCQRPFPCAYLPRCLAEGPDHPLAELPDLDRELETALHLEGVEILDDLDPARPGLTMTQRRALLSLREDRLIVEDVVGAELDDLDFPLHFVECFSTLDVLPQRAGARPWHRTPFAWVEQRLHQNGDVEQYEWVCDGKEPPRERFVESLAEALQGEGTMITYGHDVEDRLRTLLDELPEHKSSVRALLNRSILEFDKLVRAGVYHPDMHGDFSLDSVARALGAQPMPDDLELRSPADAAAAFERILAPRTRATTRKKVGEQVIALGRWRTAALIAIYQRLR